MLCKTGLQRISLNSTNHGLMRQYQLLKVSFAAICPVDKLFLLFYSRHS